MTRQPFHACVVFEACLCDSCNPDRCQVGVQGNAERVLQVLHPLCANSLASNATGTLFSQSTEPDHVALLALLAA
jgi:hypothetical protein